ncbi:MAG TPA: alpha/beta hydrolase [Actinomycetes bacterium]|jgi:pimeloyl-ACP methyl ester carboxylesterase|nr:alpha/beta hydrolase [Actinomycetes bacterium]
MTARIDTGTVELLDLAGTTLAVRRWGDPGGRPVLLWHALGSELSGAWYAEQAAVLARRGLYVVAPDGPGFGLSPALAPDAYAVPRLAELAWRVADAMALDRPVLVGHSWGGLVMLGAAAERPSDVAGLVLLDSGHTDYAERRGGHPEWTFEERTASITERITDYADVDDLRAQLQAEVRRPMTDALLAGALVAMRTTPDGRLQPVVSAATVAAAQAGMLAERPLERWPVLAAAGVDVLLLLATEPTRDPNEEGAAGVLARHPGADVRFLAGWGHDLVADGGDALAELIGDWVSRLRP